jgi:hypothetical protein
MPTADYQKCVERNISNIEESDIIHPDNAQLIKEFKRDMVLDDKAYAWIQKLTSHLKIIAE